MEQVIRFYRVKDWVKSLGFCALGLTSVEFTLTSNPFLFFLGMIQAFFLFSFLFSFNDYFDHFLEKEENFIGELIEKSVLSKEKAIFLCTLPLILSLIPLFSNLSYNYLTFYLLFVTLSITYSASKIRLRN